jgi:hypothetical protein
VLSYAIAKDGEYELEIRDAIYRGREDFVYRISIGELPFITGMRPLGTGSSAIVQGAISGWNLRHNFVQLDGKAPGPDIRQLQLQQGKFVSNTVLYQVSNAPECNDAQNNHSIETAQTVAVPCVINGCIEKPGETDVFRINGRAGEEIVAEVWARRLNSPLDSFLKIMDSTGHVLKFNDDINEPCIGLQTHNADSYIRFKLPADGTYFVQIGDVESHGSKDYVYRLHIRRPEPGFVVYVSPSGVSMPAGRSVPLWAHIARKDGFTGAVHIELENTPDGFRLDGGTVCDGTSDVCMTLTAPAESSKTPVNLKMEGTALVNGNKVTSAAIPADNLMQAFAYHQLVPAQEFAAAVTEPKRWMPTFEYFGGDPIGIPAGESVELAYRMRMRPVGRMAQFELHAELADSVPGVSVEKVRKDDENLIVVLRADAKTSRVGLKGNLVIGVSADVSRPRPDGKGNARQSVWLGALPAVQFEIVK